VSDYRNANNQAGLARFATLPAMIAAYCEAEATIRGAFSALVSAEAKLNEVYQIGKHDHANFRIDASRGRYSSCFDQPEEAVNLLKRQAWRAIVHRLELRRIVSGERWKEIDTMLDKGSLPAITEESVGDFAQGFLDRMPEILEESVKEAFEHLRPRGRMAEYKTNSQEEIPPKVIVHWVEMGCYGLRLSSYYEQHAISVERVFQALDGQGSIAKSHWSELHGAIEASKATGYRGETTWFRFKACKNGNLHLEVKRLDLLKRLNEIAGGMTLRSAKRQPVARDADMEARCARRGYGGGDVRIGALFSGMESS